MTISNRFKGRFLITTRLASLEILKEESSIILVVQHHQNDTFPKFCQILAIMMNSNKKEFRIFRNGWEKIVEAGKVGSMRIMQNNL